MTYISIVYAIITTMILTLFLSINIYNSKQFNNYNNDLNKYDDYEDYTIGIITSQEDCLENEDKICYSNIEQMVLNIMLVKMLKYIIIKIPLILNLRK